MKYKPPLPGGFFILYNISVSFRELSAEKNIPFFATRIYLVALCFDSANLF